MRSRTALIQVTVLVTAVAVSAYPMLTGAQEVTPTAGDTAAVAPDSVMFRGNPARTGFYPGPGPDGTPVLAWSQQPVEAEIRSSPVVVGDVLYVGATDGNVYAIDIVDGSELWRFSTGSPVISSAAVVADVVYIGGFGALYALDAANGQERWAFRPGDSAIDSSPVVVNGTVFVGSADGRVYAVNAQDGTELWNFPTGSPVYSSPAVVGGVVYVGAFGIVYALDAASGQELWRFGVNGGAVDTAPAVFDDIVYVASARGVLSAIRLPTADDDAALLWEFSTGGEVFASPAVARVDDEVHVFIVSGDGSLRAVNGETGAEVWRFTRLIAFGLLASSPGVAQEGNRVQVFVGSGDGYVYAIDATENGEQVWAFPVGTKVDSSPMVIDGVVYVGSQGGLVAISGS